MRTIVSAVITLLLAGGCANLPDVRPFTDATISLRSAVTTSGEQVVSELQQAGAAKPAIGDEAKKLAEAWAARNRLLTGLVEYANSLQAIVDSGNSGAESAKALAGSVEKLAQVAGIVQPGAGAVGEVVTQTAAFIYEQIAKARAAASLEKALAETQPAIERIAAVMADDMAKMNDLVRLAAKVQTDELLLSNAPQLGYREQLLKKRVELQDSMNAALRSGKNPSQLTEANELARVGELLEAADAWHGPLKEQLDGISARERVTRQLISEAKSGFGDWAAAHSQMLAAVRTKRIPSAAELVQVAQRIRELMEKFKAL